MSLITPNGTITFYHNVPLNSSYAHSLYFPGITDQENYFKDKKLFDLSNQNYVKSENGKIKIQVGELNNKGSATFNNIDAASYMSWKNPTGQTQFENSITFYAFITNVDMVSINVVEVSYQIDVLQTYVIQNKIKFKECLIERRHVDDDSDLHIEPEPLKSDDYFLYPIMKDDKQLETWDGDYEQWKVLMWAAYSLGEGVNAPNQGFVGHNYQGVRCTVFEDTEEFEDTFSDAARYNDLQQRIVSVVAVPSEFPKANLKSLSNKSIVDKSYLIDKKVDALGTYDKIKNNKLKRYPYNMLFVTDNASKCGEYAFEDFGAEKASFELYFAFQPSPEALLVPVGYKGTGAGIPNFQYSISYDSFPQIPWVHDSYKQYQATKDLKTALTVGGSLLFGSTNGVDIGKETSRVQTGVQRTYDPFTVNHSNDPFGGKAYTDKPIFGNKTSWYGGGSIASFGAQAAGNALKGKLADMGAQMYQEQRGFPAGMNGGGNLGSLCVADKKTISFFQKCIRPEVAKRFDDYFTEFGYAIGRIHTPNLFNSRVRQHYINTLGCMVWGNCPAEYQRLIESIFDNGITWWRCDTQDNIDKIGVYQ